MHVQNYEFICAAFDMLLPQVVVQLNLQLLTFFFVSLLEIAE